MSENESLLHKIKKLIDKANSTDSLEEADSLMLKAQQFLRENNLDISSVESIENKVRGIQEYIISYDNDWESKLLTTICIHNFCRNIICNDGLHIIGKANNVSICTYLYSFYKNKLLQLSMISYDKFLKSRSVDFKVPKKQKNLYLNNYLIGGVHGIYSKMKVDLDNAKKNESGLMSLILINDTDVSNYINNKFTLKKGKTTKLNKIMVGYNEGYNDGKNIGVNEGVGTTNKNKLLN